MHFRRPFLSTWKSPNADSENRRRRLGGDDQEASFAMICERLEGRIMLSRAVAAALPYVNLGINAHLNESEQARPADEPATGVDLVPISLSYSPSVVSIGDSFDVTWTVKNDGDTAVSQAIYDQVAISPTSDGQGTETVLNYNPDNDFISPGAMYTATATVTLYPMRAAATEYLILEVNAFQDQPESDFTNNTMSVPISIEIPSVDLTVSNVSAPSSAQVGDELTVSWNVSNSGIDTTTEPVYDIVYIADQPDLTGNNILLGEIAESDPIEGGGTETQSLTGQLSTSNSYSASSYIVVVTNAPLFQTETNYDNDLYARPISVVVPDVDLTVTSFTAPSQAEAGGTVDLSWTLANSGTDPVGAALDDTVFLSDSPNVDGGSLNLGTVAIDTSQANLTGKASVTLPASFTANPLNATPYLIVETNYDRLQAETDYTNNTYAVPVALTVPDVDLSPSQLSVETISNGQPFTQLSLNWVDTNNGSDTADENACDAVFISPTPTLDSLAFPVTITESYNLGPGQSTSWNEIVNLPGGSNQSNYVIVESNYGQNQAETDYSNNTISSALSGGDNQSPDLKITAATVPASLERGVGATVSWTDTNGGGGQINGGWYDAVYLSDSSEPAVGNQIFVGEQYINATLQANWSNSVSMNVALSTVGDLTGYQYLIIEADAYNYEQDSDRSNNDYVAPVRVTTPDVDLQITSIAAPSHSKTGVPFNVSWTGTNEGSETTNVQGWSDELYFSPTATLDPDTAMPLGQQSVPGPIAGGATWATGIPNVTLPNTLLNGAGYLIVETDYYGQQGESNKNNNTTAVPFYVGSAVDLTASDVIVPAQTGTGRTITVSWDDHNVGSAGTDSSWSDAIYFSYSSTLDANAILAATVPGASSIAAGGTLARSTTVQVPGGASYVIVEVNADGGEGESNPFNNTAYAVIGIDNPNLALQPVSVAPILVEGTYNGISYTVTNLGYGPTSLYGQNWTDNLYLSSTPALTSTTTLLRSNAEQSNVASESSYSDGFTAYVNDIPTGTYYLIVAVNPDQRLYETDYSDNTGVYPITVTSPDLKVGQIATDITNPSLGQTVNVTYTVANNGNATQAGGWDDEIYLSTSSTFDASAVSIGGAYEEDNKSLTAGQSYTATIAVTIPADAIGDTYLYVVAGSSEIGTDNPSDQVAGIPLLIQSVDLAVTGFNVSSPTIGLDSLFSVNATITNLGTGTTSDPWYDAVYLSPTPTLNLNTEVNVASALHYPGTPGLSGGDNYTLSFPASVTTNTTGSYYLIFETNETFSVHQPETSTSNDFAVIPISLVAPDLIPQNLAIAPASPATGSTITVSWTDVNHGTAPVTGSYFDAISIQSSTGLITTATVGYNISSGSIAPGASTSFQYTYKIADGSANTGPFRISVVSAHSGVWEGNPTGTAASNDSATLTFSPTLAPYPDLKVLNVSAGTTTPVSGQSLLVNWTDSNHGLASASGTWNDTIYLADTAAGANPVLIGTFPFTATIAPGSAIQRAAEVTIPPTIDGTKYLIVRTNSNQGFFEDDTADNSTATTQPLVISQALEPDLEIQSISVPSVVFAGETETVQWTVENVGNAPTAAGVKWDDLVYISSQPNAFATGIQLGAVVYPTDSLTVGQSYIASLNVVIPNYLVGQLYMIVIPDAFGTVGTDLKYESASYVPKLKSSNPIQSRMPSTLADLQVTSIGAPDQIFAGQAFTINATISNLGSAETFFGSWIDQFYLSTHADGSQPVQTWAVPHTGALAANGSYTVTLPVTPGPSLVGNYYLVAQTNISGAPASVVTTPTATGSTEVIVGGSAEESSGTNNTLGRAISILAIPPAQLQMTSVSAPSTAQDGQPLTITFTVANSGASTAPQTVAEVLLSSSGDPSQSFVSDQLINNVSVPALAAGHSFTGHLTFTPSYSTVGTQYVLVEADEGLAVDTVSTPNRVAATGAIQFSSMPANLVVSQISVPTSADRTAIFPVALTVKNIGTGPTNQGWYDTVYDSSGNSLGQVYVTGTLAAGQSDTETVPCQFPLSVFNAAQVLHAVVNTARGQYESNYADNTSPTASMTETGVYAPLSVTHVIVNGGVASGQTMTVSFTVTNTGTTPTSLSSWTDYLYLSTVDTVNSAVATLGTAPHSGRLQPGASYDLSLPFTVPTGISGPLFVVIRAAQGQSNSQNVDGSSANAITFNPVPPPDLRVTTVNIPETVVSGQSLSITWTVENDANTAGSGTWYDSVYLSRTTSITEVGTVFLGGWGQSGVAAMSSYQGRLTTTIPSSALGPFYIIVVANAGKQLNESGAYANDTLASSGTVIVTPAPTGTDLTVQSVETVSSLAVGQQAVFNWTVKNSGTQSAGGSWTDAVYLSPDPTLDNAEIFIGTSIHSGGLDAGASYDGSLTAYVPGVAPGNYYLLVLTDVNDSVPESTNNQLGIAPAAVMVTVPNLTLGSPVTASQSSAGYSYFSLTVSAGQVVQISVNGNSPGVANELFASFGALPTAAASGYSSTSPGSGNQSLRIPSTRAGVYYIAVYTPTGAANSQFSLTASTLTFSLTGASPAAIGNAGPVTIQISGALFSRGSVFTLTGPGNATVTASSVLVQDSTKAFATFDLTGKPAGAWTLNANGASGTASLSDPIIVSAGGGGVLKTALTGPETVHYNAVQEFAVVYTNTGNDDIPAPLLTVYSQSGATFGFHANPADMANGVLTFLGLGPTVPGILRPGESQTIPIYYESGSTDLEFDLAVHTSTAQRPIDWTMISRDARPTGLTDGQWDTIFAKIQGNIGSTDADLMRALDADANLLVPSTGQAGYLPELLDFEVARATAQLNPSISGTLSAPDTQVPVAGLTITAINETTGDTFDTDTYQDGSFVFPQVTAGTYQFLCDGALVSSSSTTIVGTLPVVGVSVSIVPGDTISGTLSTSDTHKALAGVAVLFTASDGTSYSTVTDSFGTYQYSGLPDGTYSIKAVPPNRAAAVITNIQLTSAGAVENLQSTAGSTITGSIRYDHAPASGAAIVSARVDGSTDVAEDFLGTINGSVFSIAQLPAGTYDITISQEGYQAVTVQCTIAAGVLQDVGLLSLTSTATLTGTITGPANLLPGTVQLYQGTTQVAAGQVNSDGTFSITGISAGAYTLTANTTGGVVTPVAITAIAGQAVVVPTLNVVAAATITGTVSVANSPLSGVTVQLVQPDGVVLISLSAADGSFSFFAPLVGNYILSSPGVADAQQVSVPAMGQSVVVNITQVTGTSIIGQLLDSSGHPVSGYVSIYSAGPDKNSLALATTDSSGNYAFILPTGGSFDLSASASGYTFAPVSNIAVTSGSVASHTFTAGAASLKVTLTDSTGPVAGTAVLVSITLPGGSRYNVAQATADASGIVTFTGLAAQTYQLTALATGLDGGIASASVPGQGAITIAMAPQLQLTGTVTDASGTPIPNATVTLAPAGGAAQYVAVSGADGTFKFSHLTAGSYDIVVLATGYDATMLLAMNVAAGSSPVHLSVNPAAGVITGKVLNAGVPVGSASVTAVDQNGRTVAIVFTKADGSFSLPVDGSNLSIVISRQSFVSQTFAVANVGASNNIPLGTIALIAAVAGTAPVQLSATPADLDGPINASSSYFDYLNQLRSYDPQDTKDLLQQNDDIPDAPDGCNVSSQGVKDAYNAMDGRFAELSSIAAADRALAYGLVGFVIADAAKMTSAALSVVTAAAALAGVEATATLASVIAALGNSLVNLLDDILSKPVDATQYTLGQTAGAMGDEIQSLQGLLDLLSSGQLSDGNLGLGFAGLIGNLISAINAFDFAEVNSTLNELASAGYQLNKAFDAYQKSVDVAHNKLYKYEDAIADCSQDNPNNDDDNDHQPDPGGGPDPAPTKPKPVVPHDPNDIVGPAAFGDLNQVSATQSLGYHIDFQNISTASAPAKQVTITEHLDSKLNPLSFRLGSFGFDGMTFNVPANSSYYATRIDLSATLGYDIDVTAGVDVSNGTIFWTFTTIDPTTGLQPLDPEIGFLPPDDAERSGEGYVNYSIAPLASAATGDMVSASASVVFDTQAPIDTNMVTDDLDRGVPVSSVQPLAVSSNPNFTVSWSGTDDTGGSGISYFDIYVSIDGSAFTPWLTHTTATSAVYGGSVGHAYSFYSVAVDNVGNVQATPDGAQASTTTSSSSSPLVLSGSAFYLKLDGTNLDVWQNSTGLGTFWEQVPLSGISSVTVTGTTGSDALVLDFSSGDFIPAGGLSFTGAGNELGDLLKLIGSGGNDMINVTTTQVIFDGSTINYSGIRQLQLNSGAGTDALTLQSGSLVLLSSATAATNTPMQQRFSSISIGSGAVLSVADAPSHAGRTVLLVGTLTIAGSIDHWTGTLDLGANDLVLQSGDIGTLSNQLAQGFQSGAWTGSGIISSDAEADPTHLTALGLMPNSADGIDPIYGSGTTLGAFDGINPTAESLLVKFTWFGDAALDGTVDGTDYSRIDNGYLQRLTGWSNGDFNLDGVINGSDYTLIDNAFNMQGASLSAVSATQIARTVYPIQLIPTHHSKASRIQQQITSVPLTMVAPRTTVAAPTPSSFFASGPDTITFESDSRSDALSGADLLAWKNFPGLLQ